MYFCNCLNNIKDFGCIDFLINNNPMNSISYKVVKDEKITNLELRSLFVALTRFLKHKEYDNYDDLIKFILGINFFKNYKLKMIFENGVVNILYND